MDDKVDIKSNAEKIGGRRFMCEKHGVQPMIGHRVDVGGDRWENPEGLSPLYREARVYNFCMECYLEMMQKHCCELTEIPDNKQLG